MPIVAQLDSRKRTGTLRGAPRRKLRLEVAGSSASAGETRVLVHNLSTTGLLLETSAPLSVGEPIQVVLPEAGASSARVVWASEDMYGCQFDKPITVAAVSAAQLQSPHEQDPATINVGALSGGEAAAGESLGARLKRLRKQRGFTMEGLARQVSISKPTLWKWEKDTVRPRQETVRALAKTLGVSEMELLYGAGARSGAAEGSPSLRELVESSREHIASATGIDPSRIRIIIEV